MCRVAGRVLGLFPLQLFAGESSMMWAVTTLTPFCSPLVAVWGRGGGFQLVVMERLCVAAGTELLRRCAASQSGEEGGSPSSPRKEKLLSSTFAPGSPWAGRLPQGPVLPEPHCLGVWPAWLAPTEVPSPALARPWKGQRGPRGPAALQESDVQSRPGPGSELRTVRFRWVQLVHVSSDWVALGPGLLLAGAALPSSSWHTSGSCAVACFWGTRVMRQFVIHGAVDMV